MGLPRTRWSIEGRNEISASKSFFALHNSVRRCELAVCLLEPNARHRTNTNGSVGVDKHKKTWIRRATGYVVACHNVALQQPAAWHSNPQTADYIEREIGGRKLPSE